MLAQMSLSSALFAGMVASWVTYDIPLVANSVTKMPPPEAAKPGPYDVVLGFVTMQPSLLLA